jgi:hypothetical protein
MTDSGESIQQPVTDISEVITRLEALDGVLRLSGLSADARGTVDAKRVGLVNFLHDSIGAAASLEESVGVQFTRRPEVASYLGVTAAAKAEPQVASDQVAAASVEPTERPVPPTSITARPPEPAAAVRLALRTTDSHLTDASGAILITTPAAAELPPPIGDGVALVASAETAQEKPGIRQATIEFMQEGQPMDLEKQLEFMTDFWAHFGYVVPELSDEQRQSLERELKTSPGARVLISPLYPGIEDYLQLLNSPAALGLIENAQGVHPSDLARVNSSAAIPEGLRKVGIDPDHKVKVGNNRELSFAYSTTDEAGIKTDLSFSDYKQKLSEAGLLVKGDTVNWTVSTLKELAVSDRESGKRINAARLEDNAGRVLFAFLLCAIRGNGYPESVRRAATNLTIVEVDPKFPSLSNQSNVNIEWDNNLKRVVAAISLRNSGRGVRENAFAQAWL